MTKLVIYVKSAFLSALAVSVESEVRGMLLAGLCVWAFGAIEVLSAVVICCPSVLVFE